MERIIKYTPAISLIITVVSIVRINLLYFSFGISIIPLLDASEIIFSFTEDLPFSIFFIMGLIFVYNIYNEYFTFLSDKLSNCLISIVIAIISLFVAFVNIRSAGYESNFNGSRVVIGALLILISAVMFIGITLEKKKDSLKDEVAVAYRYTYIVAVVIVYICIMLDIRYKQTNDISRIGSEFLLEDKTYKIDGNYIYIGSTNNYHFLFEKKSSTSIVIPADKVKEIKLKAYYRKE